MIKINGEEVHDALHVSVYDYLTAHDYPTTMIAVECNGMIIPKAEYPTRIFADGDAVEIVRFVGGG